MFPSLKKKKKRFQGETKRKRRKREGKKEGGRGEEDSGEFLSSRQPGNRPVTTQISPIRIPATATREYPRVVGGRVVVGADRLIYKYVNNAMPRVSLMQPGSSRWQLTYGRDQEDRLQSFAHP